MSTSKSSPNLRGDASSAFTLSYIKKDENCEASKNEMTSLAGTREVRGLGEGRRYVLISAAAAAGTVSKIKTVFGNAVCQ